MIIREKCLPERNKIQQGHSIPNANNLHQTPQLLLVIFCFKLQIITLRIGHLPLSVVLNNMLLCIFFSAVKRIIPGWKSQPIKFTYQNVMLLGAYFRYLLLKFTICLFLYELFHEVEYIFGGSLNSSLLPYAH